MVLIGLAAKWLLWIVESVSIDPAASPARPSSAPWQQYVRAPSSRIVTPLSVVASSSTGNISNPEGLLAIGGAVTTLTRAAPPIPPLWPAGTTVEASSYHEGNQVNGQARTYYPSNAVDGDPATFWNDDTWASYPDVLEIFAPNATRLTGITVLSNEDGVPIDFTVDVLIGTSSWWRAGEVKNNARTLIRVPFKTAYNTRGIRITVTRDEATNHGEFTRINEVYPGLVGDFPYPPSLVVDFGQVVVGYLSISFANASDNNPGLRLAFSETMEYLSDVSDYTRSYNGDTITPGTDQVAVSAGQSTWTDVHGCLNDDRVCSDGLHGFRYVKISLDALEADGPDALPYGSVSIDSVSLNFTAYLGNPDTFTGWFESSDAILNQFWYEAAYTNELCVDTFRADDAEPRGAASPSLVGKLVIHDGPKRDRDPYVGDLAVAGRTLYLTHNVSIAAENVLADLADHQRRDGWIPPASIGDYTLPLFDYPLWWVVSSCDLIMYTSSDDYAQKYYSTLVRVLDDFYLSTIDPRTGLVCKGLGGTSGYGDYAFIRRSGIVTYYNALYVLALRNAATIANYYNDTYDAERWTQRADYIAGAINNHLWDPSVGAYVDTMNSDTHAQDGNSIAIMASVASYTRATAALSYWSTLALPYGNPFYDNNSLWGDFAQRVYAFISYFEIAARFQVGMGDSAIEEIKRLYGWMSTHEPGTTFWEGIGPGGSKYEGPYTSLAHGWSTGVVPALSNYVLGVTPKGPAFSTWVLKPMIVGGVTWARGRVPTPKGPFEVDWTTLVPEAEFQIDFAIPPDTEGDVSIPVSEGSVTVLLDEVVVWGADVVGELNAKYEEGYVTFHMFGGRYRLTVKRSRVADL